MKTRWLLVCALVVALVITLKVLHAGGHFVPIHAHFTGSCSSVRGMPGAEDITFHPSLGYAYVSSDNRRKSMAGRPVQGGIYRFSPDTGEAPLLLTKSYKQPFHPHGISLFVDPQGKQTLYVVNHPTLGSGQIEQFELGADGLLAHKRTIRGPALVSPNDVVAVDAERFYVTNDHGGPFGISHMVEDTRTLLLGSTGRGNVVYYDGKAFREVVSKTSYANGINRSADGKTLYLAQVLAKSISVYARDPASGALSLRKVVALDTGPDNIELDQAGDLYVGAHPKALAFLAHALDRSGEERAPSEVLRIRASDGSFRVEQVYVSEGKPISAVATAAVYGHTMLLGPVFDPLLLRCQLP